MSGGLASFYGPVEFEPRNVARAGILLVLDLTPPNWSPRAPNDRVAAIMSHCVTECNNAKEITVGTEGIQAVCIATGESLGSVDRRRRRLVAEIAAMLEAK